MSTYAIQIPNSDSDVEPAETPKREVVYPRICALLFDQPWLITSRALQSLIHRVEMIEGPDLEAVASRLGRPLENSGNRVERRDTVAILDINGPIFRYANLFTELSGATSVEMLARDFQLAAENPSVEHILLRIDSPGGEVNGIHDLAAMIRSSAKPVTAYVDGLGASAGYWLAAAANQIYGSASSFTGSIGAVATISDRRGAQERQGVKTYQIVSSQSPRKLADPSTEEGYQAIQEMVDQLGALFVGSVATYRNVSPETVLKDFGQGFVKMAGPALKAGMIDGITSEEGLIGTLIARPVFAAGFTAKEDTMTDVTTGAPPPVQQPAAPAAPTAEEGAARERERIQSILTLPEAEGRTAQAYALAFEPTMTVDAARRILAAGPATVPVNINALDREMSKLKNPNVGIGTEEGTAADEAARIIAFAPANRRIKVA